MGQDQDLIDVIRDAATTGELGVMLAAIDPDESWGAQFTHPRGEWTGSWYRFGSRVWSLGVEMVACVDHVEVAHARECVERAIERIRSEHAEFQRYYPDITQFAVTHHVSDREGALAGTPFGDTSIGDLTVPAP